MGEQVYNIRIVPKELKGWAATSYEVGVRTHLSRIESTVCGQILLNSIRFWKIPVVIAPYDGSQGECNATVDGDYNAESGVIYPTVLYSPTTFARESPCARRLAEMKQTAAQLPHEVLFHELVHAFRTISKSSRKKYTYSNSTGGLYRYDNEEEFIAVLVTNIFISDPANRNKSSMRADHRTAHQLQKDLSGSFEFFRSGSATFHTVANFCKDNPGFTAALAKVAAPFNPIAAYYKNPAKALEYSQKPIAHERDASGYEAQFFERLQQSRKPLTPPE